MILSPCYLPRLLSAWLLGCYFSNRIRRHIPPPEHVGSINIGAVKLLFSEGAAIGEKSIRADVGLRMHLAIRNITRKI